MKDYLDLYLKVDVLLLACVFETFREEPISSYELDPPGPYLSSSGSRWNAMLRFINVSKQKKYKLHY